MIAAVDVHYEGDTATAAVIGFTDWADEAPSYEHVVKVTGVAPYEPGAFYKRELPPLLEVLRGRAFDQVVVDGYAWLSAGSRGLGAHLHEAIRKPVIGVAKTHFRDAPALEVLRGESKRPLYVTVAGIAPAEAAANVRRMHGPHRIPTLLALVDGLSRG